MSFSLYAVHTGKWTALFHSGGCHCTDIVSQMGKTMPIQGLKVRIFAHNV